MSWKLWLDDLCRSEGSGRLTPEGYRGAASTKEAMTLVHENGPPNFISFDFDLGEDDTAMLFLRLWTERWSIVSFPSFTVHSANPLAKD